MKVKDIHAFEILQGQLFSFYTEINTLAKKSPNDAVNKFKLGLINSVLKKGNVFLGAQRRPFPDFESFDETSVPSTSDVLLILSQYLSAFEKLRSENIHKRLSNWYWRVEDSSEDIHTGPPKKLEQ